MKKGSETCRVAPGGSRCFASFCSDVAPALYVLDARVEVTGDARRELTVDRLYTDDGIVHVQMNAEVLSLGP